MLAAILVEFTEGNELVAQGSDMNGVLIAALACLRFVTKVYYYTIRTAAPGLSEHLSGGQLDIHASYTCVLYAYRVKAKISG